MMKPGRGFTLVELMVAIAVVAVLVTLAAPSFYDFILVQRLKGINAQLVTDMQFARSEAASRGVDVHVLIKTPAVAGSMSCYSLYVDAAPAPPCDCSQPHGLRCVPSTREIRTVQIPTSSGVKLSIPVDFPVGFAFMATTGGIGVDEIFLAIRSDPIVVDVMIDTSRILRTSLGQSGRPTGCSPGGGVAGVATC
jgi:type IV fimbrial biogenesis protein FimT